jgi:conjugal transfer/entry exclusion protein
MSDFNEKVLQKLNEICVNQAVTNTKLDALVKQQTDHEAMDAAMFKDHEDRIRASERKHWYTAGIATVLATVGATLFRKFM